MGDELFASKTSAGRRFLNFKGPDLYVAETVALLVNVNFDTSWPG